MADITSNFFVLEVADLARTYSPSPARPPFFLDLLSETKGDSVEKNDSVYKKWDENFPINMIDSHVDALKISLV